MYRVEDLFDLEHTIAKEYLMQFEYPWLALKDLKEEIVRIEIGRASCRERV